MAAALRLENRLVNESETHGRVEGTLDSRVRPALSTRDVSLPSFAIEGLTVRVELTGAVDDTTLDLVRSELRRFVCRDFEVVREE